MQSRLVSGGVCCALIFLSAGCASIISGREADIAIRSNPSHARVAIQNEKGAIVATSTTPAQISLKRSNGIFKRAPRYSAVIEKPGYETAQVDIQPKVNPWILGNVVFGGVIGLAADSATGAIWRYTPDEIDQTLVPFPGEYLSENQNPDEVVTVADYATN